MLPALLLVLCAADPPPVDITSSERILLGRHMAILEDPGAGMTLQDVLAPDVQARFAASPDDEPRFAYTRSAYWVRLILDGEDSAQRLLELSYPLHDRVDVYVIGPEGASVQRGGDAFPFALRPIKHRHFVFPVTTSTGHTPVYIRVQSRAAMQLAMTLWEPAAFASADHEYQFGLGLFYGLFLTMALFNLLLLITARDRSYAWFVMFVASVGLLDAGVSGIAFEYIWPDSPSWNKTSIPFMVLVGCGSACMFSRAYLSARIYAPRHHVLLKTVAMWSVVSSVAVFFLDYQTSIALAILSAGVGPLLSVLAGHTAWRAGYQPARYFVVALLLLIAGIVLFALRLLGVLPSNLVTQYGLQVGSIAVFFLFSMGLGERIQSSERERELAQRSEREKVEALNAQLEHRVVERTRELAEKNAELGQLNARKDELVATVSHDFRSPLTVIRQNVQTILRDLTMMDQEDLKELLGGIARQEARLTGMCTSLLDLARLKQRGVEHVPVDIPRITETIIDGFMTRARNASVTLRHEPVGEIPRVEGDPGRLEQVVQNLVDNALKFTPSGGTVTVRVDGKDGHVRVSVKDSGVGIPADAVPRLFDPFFQVPSPSFAGQGSGLGLAIVKAVVDAHGGRVEVESAPGAGATFTVELPALRA